MNFSRLKIGGLLLTAAGVVTLFASMVAWFHTRSFIHAAPRIQGRVIKLVEGYAGSNYSTKVYYPVYVFTDAQGWHQIWSGIGSHPAACNVGDTVSLLYNTVSPRDSKPYTFWNVWSGPVEQCGAGLLVLLAGLGALYAARSE